MSSTRPVSPRRGQPRSPRRCRLEHPCRGLLPEILYLIVCLGSIHNAHRSAVRRGSRGGCTQIASRHRGVSERGALVSAGRPWYLGCRKWRSVHSCIRGRLHSRSRIGRTTRRSASRAGDRCGPCARHPARRPPTWTAVADALDVPLDIVAVVDDGVPRGGIVSVGYENRLVVFQTVGISDGYL